MNRILNFLCSLNWAVLFAVPVLSVMLGVANDLRVPEDKRVIWSGRLDKVPKEIVAPNVERGRWTSDFVAATNAAEMANLPVVVVVMISGCQACARFHREVQSEKVKNWQKKLGWYFVLTSSAEMPAALTFVKNTPVRNKKAPYVGVYWSRADGKRVMRNFTAKSKNMGVPAEPSLGDEWMHAVEASVPGAPGISFIPQNGVGVQIAVKSDKGKTVLGRVKMSPKVDVIQPGQKVILSATPRDGAEFVGWRYPNGQIVYGGPQLTLDDQCQAGVYGAIFRRHNVKEGVPKTDGNAK